MWKSCSAATAATVGFDQQMQNYVHGSCSPIIYNTNNIGVKCLELLNVHGKERYGKVYQIRKKTGKYIILPKSEKY